MIPTFSTAAAAAPPAGGATLGQVVIASTAAMVLTAVLLYIGFGYRAGRLGWLRRLAAWSEQVGGYPAWVGIPAVVATVSLLIALFGMYWDISLHIDVGRDPGPLA